MLKASGRYVVITLTLYVIFIEIQQLIDSTKISVPLLELAVEQGFNENSDNKRAYRLGVDAR